MKTVFMTGSGLSAESGLKTFRGPDGLYRGIRAEVVLSAEGLRRNPEIVDRFIMERRKEMNNAKPNQAHIAIAEYAKTSHSCLVFTQNIDTLLEQAGAPDVIHLHGEVDWQRCVGGGHRHKIASIGPEAKCPDCKARLRTDVVLFGEVAPNYTRLYEALARLNSCDALVVIGTQGNVVRIGQALPAISAFKVLVNLHHSPYMDESKFDISIIEEAGTGVPKALEAIRDKARGQAKLDDGASEIGQAELKRRKRLIQKLLQKPL